MLKIIERGIAKLIENYESGQKIQERLWPKYYKQKYGINNLWRLRLDQHASVNCGINAAVYWFGMSLDMCLIYWLKPIVLALCNMSR